MAYIKNKESLAIGQQLRTMRINENLTQAELADRVGAARLSIVEIEAGGNVGLHILAKVMAVLGVKLENRPLLPSKRKRVRVINKKIDGGLFPQLNIIMWDRLEKVIPESEAFSLYERNKRFIDIGTLDQKEALLIDKLTKKYSNGVML